MARELNPKVGPGDRISLINMSGEISVSPLTAGTVVKVRIRLNDGATGTLNDAFATTNNSATVVTLATTAGVNNATAIRSTSSANAKDFVCLYDNTAGTGRQGVKGSGVRLKGKRMKSELHGGPVKDYSGK